MSVVLLDSVFRIGKNYYPQVFLEEYKYVIKEKNIHSYIIGDVEISSDSVGKNSNGKKFWLWRKFSLRNSGKKSDGKKFWMKKILNKIEFFSTYIKNGKKHKELSKTQRKTPKRSTLKI